jgi:phosphoribosylanthranilate isomerase
MLQVRRTRIKFCGITRPADAIAAANAGADAIGLIFYHGSSRYVTIDQARDIVQSLPPMVTPVGLFVDALPDEIRKTAGSLNLRTIQLHGNERPEMIADLGEFRIIKAVKYSPVNFRSMMEVWRDTRERCSNLTAMLMETGDSPEPGGTGLENNWNALQMFFKSQSSLGPIIAAGGLTPENVGDVVRLLCPYAVDVSTGIEESRGIKSVDKMNRFASEVRSADQNGD